MSVINQVLKELDRQGANAVTPNGVIAVNQRDAVRLRWPLRLILWLIVLIGLAFGFGWWQSSSQPPVSSSANSAAPEWIEPAPRLRLSDQLSPVAETARSGDIQAKPALPVTYPVAVVSKDAVSIAAAKPRLDTRLPELPVAQLEKSRPVKTEPVKVETVKVEPVKTEVVVTPVMKDIKPPTLQVQAEEAWRQARRLFEQGRQHDAQEQLESALRLDPAHVAARQRWVGVLLEKGASREAAGRAETLLREGVDLHPSDPWFSRSLAQLQLQRGDGAAAATTLKVSLEKRPDATNWGLYAGMLAKLGKPAEAAQAYREALRMNPGQGNWWIGFAVALEQSGEASEAAAAYQRALHTRLSNELREFAQQKARELGGR